MRSSHKKGIISSLLVILLTSPSWAGTSIRFIDKIATADTKTPYISKIPNALWEKVAEDMAEIPQLQVSRFDRHFTFDKMPLKKIRLFQEKGRTRIVDYYPPVAEGIISSRVSLDKNSIGGLVLARSTRDYRIIALGRRNNNFLMLGRVEANVCRWDYFRPVPQAKNEKDLELSIVFRGPVLMVFVNGRIVYVTTDRPESERYRIGTVELMYSQGHSGVEITQIRHRNKVEDEFNTVSVLIWAHLKKFLQGDMADEYSAVGELVFRPGIRKEYRTALLFTPSTRISFPVEIPAEATMEFGLGAHSLGNIENYTQTNDFQVTLIGENGQEINLFSQTVGKDLTEHWQDIRLDLSPYAGFRGKIVWDWKVEPDAIPQNILFLANPKLTSAPSPGKKPANVILYLIDSLRADRLGCYGNTSNLTPNIDRWAENEIQFDSCYTQAPWSLPALSTLFTSQYPYTHQVFFLGDRLDEDSLSLAQILRKQGYTTASFSENPVTGRISGLDRGFDFLDFNQINPERLQKWIERNRSAPFFLYVHLQNPHMRYQPPEHFLPKGITTKKAKDLNRKFLELSHPQSFSGDLRDLVDIRKIFEEKLHNILPDIKRLYDGEVATADYRFGELIKILQKLHLENETLTILTSNHGEEFDEHDELLHGRSLYNAVLQIPLILHLPGPVRHGMNINEPVGLIDILPTILDISGRNVVETQGVSLLPTILGSPGKRRRNIFAVRNSFRIHSPKRGKRNVSVIDGKWKAIYNQDPETMELYDIISDPEEINDLTSDYPNQTQVYKEKILRWLEGQGIKSDINEWLNSVL